MGKSAHPKFADLVRRQKTDFVFLGQRSLVIDDLEKTDPQLLIGRVSQIRPLSVFYVPRFLAGDFRGYHGDQSAGVGIRWASGEQWR